MQQLMKKTVRRIKSTCHERAPLPINSFDGWKASRRATYSPFGRLWLSAFWVFMFIHILCGIRRSVKTMDPDLSKELVQGPGTAEYSYKMELRLPTVRIICGPRGTLRYKDMLRCLRSSQAPPTRSNVCFLPRAAVIRTPNLTAEDVQLDLAQLSGSELQILSSRVMREVRNHDQDKQQYAIPLEVRAQRIFVVTDAMRIIEEQLTQGAQLVATTTELWMTVQHHSMIQHIQQELQQAEDVLDQVRVSAPSPNST